MQPFKYDGQVIHDLGELFELLLNKLIEKKEVVGVAELSVAKLRSAENTFKFSLTLKDLNSNIHDYMFELGYLCGLLLQKIQQSTVGLYTLEYPTITEDGIILIIKPKTGVNNDDR